jgi:regulator of sigma E protease
MSFLYSVVGFLIAISILVAVHEFGHFWAARRLGVKVLKFSIGFGKPLWSRVSGPDQTEYRLAAIPWGGYVHMLGEGGPDTPIDPKDAHRSFDAQPIWKRSIIAAAGPAINFMFAALLFMFLGFSSEQQFKPVFGELPATSKLAELGVNSGDRLLEVDGKAVVHLSEYNLYIFNQVLKGEPIEFKVEDVGKITVGIGDAGLSDGQSSVRTVLMPTEDMPLYNINPSSLIYQVGLIPYFPPADTTLGTVLEDSPAFAAGLRSGDRIININGVDVLVWRELTDLIAPNADQSIELKYEREGSVYDISLTP